VAVQCDYQGPRFAGRNAPLNEKRKLIAMVMEIGLGVCVAAIALQAGRWVISPMAIPRFITTTRTIYRVLC